MANARDAPTIAVETTERIQETADHCGHCSDTSSDEEPPEITVDSLSADTLAALTAHLAVQDADKVRMCQE